MSYKDFVKANYDNVRNLPAKERFGALSAMWNKQKLSGGIVSGGKMKNVKGGIFSGGDLNPNQYSQVAFGYNPSTNQYFYGTNDYNKPYMNWLHEPGHSWMMPFGNFLEQLRNDTNDFEEYNKLKDEEQSMIEKANDYAAIARKIAGSYMVAHKLPNGQYPKLPIDIHNQVKVYTDKSNEIWKQIQINRNKLLTMDSPISLSPQHKAEYLNGYDETQKNINHLGRKDYLWGNQENDPGNMLTDTAEDLGRYWCIMYNRSWQSNTPDQNKWKEALHYATLGADLGLKAAEMLV